MAAAATRATVTQRLRPRSLRLPNKGLLTAEAKKIPLSATPVHFGSYPRAFCRKRELRLLMLAPAKSRRLKATQYAAKNNQMLRCGNSGSGLLVVRASGGDAASAESASEANKSATRIPRMPSSITGRRHAAGPRVGS